MKTSHSAPVQSCIQALQKSIQNKELSYSELIEQCLSSTQLPSAAHVFTKTYEASARAVAKWADSFLKEGVKSSELMGLPITIKDLYDVAGETTESGTLVLGGGAAAAKDAVIVQRIRQAGMAILGKTNMSEFAFSGVGINPHFGTPQNPSDPVHHRVPGGSSSGAAVSVALGLCVGAVGSDTGGSIRIPAALCGLVGFKSSMNRVPTGGAVELARSLDTVCAMSQSVSDCLSIDAVLSAQPLTVRPKEVKGLRLAVAKTIMQDALEPAVAKTFERTLDSLSASGAQIVEIDLKELQEISQINAPGGLSPIESYSAYSHFVDHKSEQMDHRVVKRMLMGKGVTAQQYLKILDARRDWISRVERALNSFDALISPTVPIQAPLTQSLLDSDDEFFRVNGLLLRNTFAINFLDGCAFSIPMHQTGELPMGLMISGCRGDDAHIASVSLAVESLLNRHR